MAKKLTKLEKEIAALMLSPETAPVVDAAPGLAAVSGLDAVQAASDAVLSVADACETLGALVAGDDEGAGDRFAEGRKLGLLPAVQGDDESGAKYDERVKAFTPPKDAMGAFMRGYVRTSQPRVTKPFSLFLVNETDGTCRDAKPGDNPAKVKTYSPVDCFLMDKSQFMALPGKSDEPDTLKGRVWGSRESMQGIGAQRKSRFLSEGKDAGRIIEAATGAKSGGKGRGGNKAPAEKIAALSKSCHAHYAALGTDLGISWKAAMSAFVDDCVARKLLTKEQWAAAVAASK